MNALGHDFARIYSRELDRLASEISAYHREADLWTTIGAQKNPPGALALHSAGTLLSRIGAVLGNTGYVRDRDVEFSGRDVPRDEILLQIRTCRDTIIPILENLDNAALAQPYPGPTPESLSGASTQCFLIHLIWHLGWHLGHIYYHRRGIEEAEMATAH